MQHHTEKTKEKNSQIIQHFIQSFTDSRKKESKQIRETNLLCRKMIEERIAEKSDINRLLFKYQDDPWVKKILVSYILLKMYHNSAFWNAEDSESI